MAQGTAHRQRSYSGPIFLSGGFRPFFLLGAIWAAIVILLWLGVIVGWLDLPTAFEPVDWHAHELIFGYGAAIVCGFLLTAVPNWTGRLPVMGWPLAGLAGLWVAGRVAVTVGAALPLWIVALVDLSFLVTLVAVIGREIWAGANWRNLPVVGLTLAMLIGNVVYHAVAAPGLVAAAGVGGRIGAAVLVMLISLVGGRVVPSFTRNWLARQGPGRLPIPINAFDQAALAVTAVALILWISLPSHGVTAAALAIAGVLQAIRMARWAGDRTYAEPLLFVLHFAYAFVPFGFLLTSAAIPLTGVDPIVGLHAWMTGAVGLMTLAMMTRASLGHTGRDLRARPVDIAIFLLAAIASVARITAGLTGGAVALDLSAFAWIGAFALFAVAYWPILTMPRIASKKPTPSPRAT